VSEPPVAALTGASAGIGRAIALELAATGATLALASRDGPRGRETLEMVEAAGGSGGFTRLDVTSAEDIEAWIGSVHAEHGRLDWLVNNAGISGGWVRIEDQTAADYRLLIETNLLSACFSLRAALPLMRAAGGGAVVNVCSTASLWGIGMMSVYSATKHALLGLTRGAAQESADVPIRVNAVCPGIVDTELMRGIECDVSPDDPGAASAAFADTVPLKRYATPLEVAKVTRFLLSDEASYMTGAAVPVDGGVLSGK
jgi:NAD(P)-dependent dehydrogenase (short-subunit alcohol dehydrogenase family)